MGEWRRLMEGKCDGRGKSEVGRDVGRVMEGKEQWKGEEFGRDEMIEGERSWKGKSDESGKTVGGRRVLKGEGRGE